MEKHQYFINKILKSDILIDFMKQNNIDNPKEIKECFIESFGYFEYPDIYTDERKKLDEILKDIEESDMMYKNVVRFDIKQKIIDSEKNKGFHIIKIEINLGEEEKAPIPPCRWETILELEKNDSVKCYDIMTFGISYLIRDIKLFKEYKINYYIINREENQGEKIFTRTFWK